MYSPTDVNYIFYFSEGKNLQKCEVLHSRIKKKMYYWVIQSHSLIINHLNANYYLQNKWNKDSQRIEYMCMAVE